MKIITLNLNGIRSASRKGFYDWFPNQKADFVCLQELKAHQEDLDEQMKAPKGYFGNFSYANKKGYSGVAILSKHKPLHVEYGTGISYMDFEGRNIRLDFKDFSVMSLYLPSGTNLDRLEFKLNYMDDYL